MLPTLETAKRLVELNDKFYIKEENVKDLKFLIFNYRLTSYSDFKDYEHLGSLNLRGTAFLENGERFISFHKFFNYNENPYTQFPIQEDEVIEAREKIDGSVIHPIVVNNEIFVKSKTTFTSFQSELAKKIIERNSNYALFIKDCYKQRFVPLFELVSPRNQIVISYSQEELILLNIRNLDTGEYMKFEDMERLAKEYNINYAKRSFFSYKELLNIVYNAENIEGFVCIKDNTFFKLKTKWYLSLHTLIGDIKEDIIFNLVLEDKIDDLLSNLSGTKKQEIEALVKVINNKVNDKIKEANNLFEKYKALNFNRKEFALQHSKDFVFGAVVSAKSQEEVERNVIELLKKKVNSYTKVLEFLGK